MPHQARPLSPHLQIYRWQIQMVTSILHRATGVALVAGSVLVLAALLALASGPEAFAQLRAFCSSWLGMLLLLGFAWSLSYHLLNGIRHVLQDMVMGYEIPQFVRNSWIVVIGSVVLTAVIWFCALYAGGAA